MIWSFVKHRGGAALYSHGTRGSIALVVGAVAVVLFGVDGNLFVHTLADMHGYFWNFKRAEASEGAVRIEVNAHQWSWDARYPGADGRFGTQDRKSTRLNSSHSQISYAVFCLKTKIS